MSSDEAAVPPVPDPIGLLLPTLGLGIQASLRTARSADLAIVRLRPNGTVGECNKAGALLFGWSPDALCGRPYAVLFPLRDRYRGLPRRQMEAARKHVCTDAGGRYERRDGTPIWCSGLLISLPDGGFASILRDSSGEKGEVEALREEAANYRMLVEAIPQLVWRSLDEGEWDWAGPQWCRHTGQSQDQAMGMGWLDRVHPDDRQRTRQRWSEARTLNSFEVDHRILAADGSCRWFQTRASPTEPDDTGTRIWFGTSTDIGDIRDAQEKILFLAGHDGLTGAINRAGLGDALDKALRRKGGTERVCLLFVDLDHFRRCNERVGHRNADLLLRQVADRLRARIGSHDLLARVGGDEFAVLHGTASPDAAMMFARDLLAAFADPFEVEGNILTLSASVGLVLCPDHGDQVDLLLHRGSVALRCAKSAGGSQLCPYRQDMEQDEEQRRLLVADLTQAVAEGTLHVEFQPFFEASSRDRPRGFEALARWRHPVHGPIGPDRFIPLAEAAGLIGRLGELVLERACRAATGWDENTVVAVNLSPLQFRDGDLGDTIPQVLAATGLPPHRLELEVTESLMIEGAEQVIEVLHRIRALGVRIVLDDFGTGYSNLGYLARLPFDKVKIDRSFVGRMTTDKAARTITAAVVALGHSLGLAVTAEGVETEDQFTSLRSLGCDQMQGFLLGRPISSDAIPGAGSAGAGLRPG